MKLLHLYTIFFIWVLSITPNELSGQITISPEVGVSYLPFKFVGANTQTYSKKGNLMLGLAAQLPIHKRWYINTRVSFSDRENVMWVDLCLCPGYKYNRYEQSDINLDFSVHYLLTDYIHFGIGPAIIRKNKTSIIFLDTTIAPEEVYYSENRFEYGAQAIVTFQNNFVALKLEYARKLYNYELSQYVLRGLNRYNVVLAIPIFLGKRRA